MRGLSPAERRSEMLRAWTFLGLVADDVALAALRYPELDAAELKALTALLEMTAGDTSGDERRPMIPRRSSMSDPSSVLHEAAVLARSDGPTTREVSADELEFIREPLRKMLESAASAEQVKVVLQFAELLGQITLSMTEQLANEKGATEWTPRASDFSLV